MMGIVFAQPLLRLRAEHPGAGTAEMELALDRWYFQESYQYLEEARKAGKNLMDAIQLEAAELNDIIVSVIVSDLFCEAIPNIASQTYIKIIFL